MTAGQPHRPVRVVTDSAADIPPELAQQLLITVVPLLVRMGDKTFRDGVDISGEQFYRKLEATRSVTTTSLPALSQFTEAYRALTGDGFDVVSIHMSSRLSGTFNAALMASTDDGVQDEAISVVDTRTLSMAEGWVAVRAAEAAAQGKSRAEVERLAQTLSARTAIYGVLDTLEYVVRSGRVSAVAGALAGLADVKPILTVLPNGEASILERVRTRARALDRLVELVSQLGPLDALAVMHGDDPNGAARLEEMLARLNPPAPVVVGHIGAMLGTHIGPGGVGVCCLRAG